MLNPHEEDVHGMIQKTDNGKVGVARDLRGNLYIWPEAEAAPAYIAEQLHLGKVETDVWHSPDHNLTGEHHAEWKTALSGGNTRPARISTATKEPTNQRLLNLITTRFRCRAREKAILMSPQFV